MKPDLSAVMVPEWVCFIAQDSDGSWWGYSVEPLQNHRGWYENEVGQYVKLLSGVAVDEWQHSLSRLKRDFSEQRLEGPG